MVGVGMNAAVLKAFGSVQIVAMVSKTFPWKRMLPIKRIRTGPVQEDGGALTETFERLNITGHY